jgi:hypothetical protein
MVLSFLVDSVALAVSLVVVLAFALGIFAVRRRVLSRRGGAFSCALRRRHAGLVSARGWTLGVARYCDDYVEWFRIFSLSPRARVRLDRRALVIRKRRVPHGIEAYAVPHGSTVLVCTDAEGPLDLALSDATATGLLVWLEAVPPGVGLTL